MSLAVIRSRASFGINAPLVTVEVHLSNGLPSMSIVGLASAEVKESKERVRSAILNSEYEFPAKRIIINLGPADLPKSGGRFDLSIALGILVASKQLAVNSLDQFEVLGELSLNGELRSVSGVLNSTLEANKCDRKILIPEVNAKEAALTESKKVFCASTLKSACMGLTKNTLQNVKLEKSVDTGCVSAFNMADIKGNKCAKRALIVAASGGHNVLFSGSPGSGKTMLARALPGILDPLSLAEALEIVAIESIAKEWFSSQSWRTRRFRSPHHNCTVSSITGGGNSPIPGEMSLAHRGVLFFDELPEYSRAVLESLRQPLEDGYLTVSRARWKVSFPARFQFIAAMNPCPCGYFASNDRECHCSNTKVLQYLSRISGPLLDRFDLQVMVNNPKLSLLDINSQDEEDSSSIKQRVSECRALQIKRQDSLNNELSAERLLSLSALDKSSRNTFNSAIKHYQLSVRAQQKVLRVSRTIADLSSSALINEAAIIEALSYRSFEQLLKKARAFL